MRHGPPTRYWAKKKKRKLQNEKNILLLKNEKEIRHAIPNAVPPFYAV